MSPWRVCRLINNSLSHSVDLGLRFAILYPFLPGSPTFPLFSCESKYLYFHPHRSKVLAKISALIAAIVIGRPRIDPDYLLIGNNRVPELRIFFYFIGKGIMVPSPPLKADQHLNSFFQVKQPGTVLLCLTIFAAAY